MRSRIRRLYIKNSLVFVPLHKLGSFFFFLAEARIDLAKGFYDDFKMVPSVNGDVDEFAQFLLSHR